MGMNTGIFILNDAFREIEQNPEGFVMDINRAMNDSRDRVLRVFGRSVGSLFHELHADFHGLYLLGGNRTEKMGTPQSYSGGVEGGYEKVKLEALKSAAEKLGYHLVKTKEKAKG